eukprot:10120650-Ditylum_brightwellii.AAC.2
MDRAEDWKQFPPLSSDPNVCRQHLAVFHFFQSSCFESKTFTEKKSSQDPGKTPVTINTAHDLIPGSDRDTEGYETSLGMLASVSQIKHTVIQIHCKESKMIENEEEEKEEGGEGGKMKMKVLVV